MRTILFFLLVFSCVFTGFSQKTELVDTGTFVRPLRTELFDFQYITNVEDTDKLIYVGKIKAYGKGDKSRLRNLYFSILNQVQVIGGNCFRLSSYEIINSTKEAVLELEIYHGNREFLDLNSTIGDRVSYHIFPASSDLTDTLYINRIKVPFSVENPFSGSLEKDEILKIQLWRNGPVMSSMVFDGSEFRKDRFFIVRSGRKGNGGVAWGPLNRFIYMEFMDTRHRVFEEIDQGLANLIMELWN